MLSRQGTADLCHDLADDLADDLASLVVSDASDDGMEVIHHRAARGVRGGERQNSFLVANFRHTFSNYVAGKNGPAEKLLSL